MIADPVAAWAPDRPTRVLLVFDGGVLELTPEAARELARDLNTAAGMASATIEAARRREENNAP